MLINQKKCCVFFKISLCNYFNLISKLVFNGQSFFKEFILELDKYQMTLNYDTFLFYIRFSIF